MGGFMGGFVSICAYGDKCKYIYFDEGFRLYYSVLVCINIYVINHIY